MWSSGLKKIMKNPWHLAIALSQRGLLNWMPDKAYLKCVYRGWMGGKKLNLKNPQTFNEKLQWLKLYNRKPIYTTMVDKYASKKFIANLIGEEYVIPCVGGPWKSVDEIDFDSLPNQFVLKTNHDCGGVVICKDKSTFDLEKAKEILARHLKRDYYIEHREWPYKNVERCIFAEKYLEEESGVEAIDYKVMCFNGKPKLIQLHLGRFTYHTQDFYDINWQKQEYELALPKSDIVTPKPEFLDKMLEMSEKVSEGISQVRCDWYYTGGRLYFGEATFFEDAGFGIFEPKELDYTFGSWITLPEKTEKK